MIGQPFVKLPISTTPRIAPCGTFPITVIDLDNRLPVLLGDADGVGDRIARWGKADRVIEIRQRVGEADCETTVSYLREGEARPRVHPLSWEMPHLLVLGVGLYPSAVLYPYVLWRAFMCRSLGTTMAYISAERVQQR